jgi:probable DNA repair protein
MIRVALDLLRWAQGSLAVTRISALLVSPLFAMVDAERNARATFDAFEFRKAKLLRPQASIGWLADAIAYSKRRIHLPHLLDVLRKMDRAGQSLAAPGERRKYGKWADIIREFLQTAQWRRSTGEDSFEFQIRRKWESALDELATLDFDAARVSFQEALGALENVVQSTMFAPESRQTPVQVMGPLEAAGSAFDALWFLGAGDLTWPAKATVHPLLPWALQRELGIPGTGAAADDARARRVMQRIAESAPIAIFSYAAESSNGKQRPSPVLDVLQLESIPVEKVAPLKEQRIIVELEQFTDTTPLPPTPDQVIPGGAELLHLQAACGFRAFAERRLWSTELREIELGMDAPERGTIVHQTLEHFWNEVKTQAQLKAMNASERSDALDRAIEHALRRAVVGAQGWDQAYVDVQRVRLRNLLVSWLELELRRDPFFVKLSEKSFDDIRIGPLRLNVRVDRVDVTDNGDIIIDYKTGSAKPADWQSSRPDAPQLPLYAVLAATAQPETTLADLAFAQIRPGKEMALNSFASKVTNQQTKTKTQPRTLDEQLDEWRHVLTNLAEAFHQGDARVDPKKYPSTCSYCAQRILCRLDPAAFDEELDDEATIDTGNGEPV